MLKKHKPHPLTGPEAAMTCALPPPHHHPHFLETSETKSLPPAAHFISSLKKMLKDSTVVLNLLCTFRLRFFRFPIQKASWQLLSVSMAFTLYTNNSRLFFKAGTWLVRLVSWRIWFIMTKLVRTFQINTLSVTGLKQYLHSRIWCQSVFKR